MGVRALFTRLHEDPETDFERMLEANDWDCSRYGCWAPAVFVVQGGVKPDFQVCAEHIDGRLVVGTTGD